MRGSRALFFLAYTILLGNIIFSLYLAPTHTFAQESQFQPLAGIPGLTDIGGRDEDRLVNLLNAGYRLAITIGALAAVFQISFAGFKYLSSAGNHGGMGEAKATITASLAGLLLILSTVLILETISGEIKLDPLRGAPPVSIATQSPAVTTGGSGALTGGTGSPESGRVCQSGASQGSSTNCTLDTNAPTETSTEREPIYIEVGCDGNLNVQWGNSGCVPLLIEPSEDAQCESGYQFVQPPGGGQAGCLLYSYGTIETECREGYYPRGGTCYLTQ